MTKKLIPISVILALAMMLGLVGATNAAYDSVTFATDTTINVGTKNIVAKANSKVVSMVVNADDTVTLTLAYGSSITFTSADTYAMTLDQAIATYVCGSSSSSIVIPYNASYPTVILTVGAACNAAAVAPKISAVEVLNPTTVTVTMTKNMAFAAGKTSATLIAAGAVFALQAPTSVSINGKVLTLTFADGVLAGAGVKDTSVVSLPASQLVDTDAVAFAAATSVVTDLSTINQLYDFVFLIQNGQNFMSIPYDVTTALADSYAAPSGSTISIQTIGDAGGNFATASSYSVLYGYYINSNASTDVYLRLKKNSSQSATFSRTFSAAGWHIIGVASNNVSNCLGAAANVGDAAVVSSLVVAGTAKYDRVVDMSVGITGDTNAGVVSNGTYDATLSIYKAKLNGDYIVDKIKTQIDAVTEGIEFNHGEAYFIYITTQNAIYIGDQVSTGNLIL